MRQVVAEAACELCHQHGFTGLASGRVTESAGALRVLAATGSETIHPADPSWGRARFAAGRL
ncbi:hypothetical protein [Streptomyces sp. WMMB303]|nr:hypothetical protein [Streptomyces sp. WMMB303]MDF4251598.1 hypothetical protein [Streptomyces sp. WMMB303]